MLLPALLAAVAAPAWSADEAVEIIDRAIAAHGASNLSTLALHLEGTFDLATRFQGRTLASEPKPISERITIDASAGRVAYDVRWHNYTYSVQELREIYDAENRVLFIDKRNASGGWMPGAPVPDAAARYARYLPQRLLQEARAARATLRLEPALSAGAHAVDVVSFATAAGDELTLYLDAEAHLLRGATAMIDMPVLGDTEIMWTWLGYEPKAGAQFPTRMQTWLGARLLKDVAVTIDLAPGMSAFTTPEAVSVGPAPAPRPMTDFVPHSERPPQVETLGEGLYLVRSLRPGFHLLFVEFEDFVVAVDAPTGWYEMQQIPPMNWSPGESSSALSEKYLRAIAETVPGKPVRYVVLTHHHSDHIGGVRAFLAAGATVIAAAPAAALARRAAASRCTLGPDRWSGNEHLVPPVEVVSGERTISDGNRSLRLIELPPGNPKADGYLMVYVADAGLLYASAFLYPVPREAFPPAESLDLSIYFTEWLDASGLKPEAIYNVHGMGKVEAWHLDEIRRLAREHEPAWRADQR